MSYIVDETRQIIPVIKFLLPTLTNSEKKAAEYLLAHPAEVVNLSLTSFAQASESSQAAIIRLCKHVGVGGYASMKTQLAMQLSASPGAESISEMLAVNTGESAMALLVKRVFETNIQTLIDTMALYSEEYERALNAVLNTQHITFFAIGDAMYPCATASFKFRKLGYTCYADHDPDTQVINACNLRKGDVAIVVSHTGKTRQVVSAAKIAHKRGATVICITKYDKSPLLKYCDIRLFTATADIIIGQEIPARRVAENAILEAIFLAVLEHGIPHTEKRIQEISSGMKEHKIK